jgi:hypothetical protein
MLCDSSSSYLFSETDVIFVLLSKESEVRLNPMREPREA